jgi:hypothetical protein
MVNRDRVTTVWGLSFAPEYIFDRLRYEHGGMGVRVHVEQPATAKALAESKAWDGQLPNITAFESPDSVEIATALAKREGPHFLPSLTKISPKTLTALIEKEDVEIPLIETLELIQEPDGSPTEDFVIPKGFQSRQKARQQGR